MDASKPAAPAPRRMTVPDFRAAKQAGRKLTVLTAYDHLWASILDESGVDALLVGDTLGMVVQGRESTLPVTLRDMLYHGEMVARAARRSLVIVDLPFMTYQLSPLQARRNAGRIIKETGAAAVKLESGATQAATIAALADIDIQVMAHIGMRPQSIRKYGRMSAIQRDREQLMADALAAEAAGAFSIVLELIPRSIAREITEALSIPTIGIGAGPDCDGQVLVTPDMLGMTAGFNPKYLKRYADIRAQTIAAAQAYITDVQSGEFPDAAHSHE
ncbi:MAG: 3-methyl-2-oxobutanoate hydroxymethyltransferase [Planctomycetaceae bacterium]|nr:3-methyl-2-oxobutanoate hydroxymethyltransferase [Planctomycetaceae bacterium]